ncbi:cyclase family protein [Thermodesulfobacteriota bacterium]
MSEKNLIWLSHPLSVNTPAYGDGEGMRLESMTQIAAGDTANTYRFVLPNHLGTHIDTPRHFFNCGSSLLDYPPEFWIFDSPVLVDVPGKDGYLISPKDVEGALTPQNDLLLLRTGYEAFRDDSRYWQHNPGLAPELGIWLREQFPNIRAVGMDVISVTSRHHRPKGRETHRVFLDPEAHGTPVLPIEDMSLAGVKKKLAQVIIMPLRVSNTDSGPCTALGLYAKQCY